MRVFNGLLWNRYERQILCGLVENIEMCELEIVSDKHIGAHMSFENDTVRLEKEESIFIESVDVSLVVVTVWEVWTG